MNFLRTVYEWGKKKSINRFRRLVSIAVTIDFDDKGKYLGISSFGKKDQEKMEMPIEPTRTGYNRPRAVPGCDGSQYTLGLDKKKKDYKDDNVYFQDYIGALRELADGKSKAAEAAKAILIGYREIAQIRADFDAQCSRDEQGKILLRVTGGDGELENLCDLGGYMAWYQQRYLKFIDIDESTPDKMKKWGPPVYAPCAISGKTDRIPFCQPKILGGKTPASLYAADEIQTFGNGGASASGIGLDALLTITQSLNRLLESPLHRISRPGRGTMLLYLPYGVDDKLQAQIVEIINGRWWDPKKVEEEAKSVLEARVGGEDVKAFKVDMMKDVWMCLAVIDLDRNLKVCDYDLLDLADAARKANEWASDIHRVILPQRQYLGKEARNPGLSAIPVGLDRFAASVYPSKPGQKPSNGDKKKRARVFDELIHICLQGRVPSGSLVEILTNKILAGLLNKKNFQAEQIVLENVLLRKLLVAAEKREKEQGEETVTDYGKWLAKNGQAAPTVAREKPERPPPVPLTLDRSHPCQFYRTGRALSIYGQLHRYFFDKDTGERKRILGIMATNFEAGINELTMSATRLFARLRTRGERPWIREREALFFECAGGAKPAKMSAFQLGALLVGFSHEEAENHRAREASILAKKEKGAEAAAEAAAAIADEEVENEVEVEAEVDETEEEEEEQEANA